MTDKLAGFRAEPKSEDDRVDDGIASPPPDDSVQSAAGSQPGDAPAAEGDAGKADAPAAPQAPKIDPSRAAIFENYRKRRDGVADDDTQGDDASGEGAPPAAAEGTAPKPTPQAMPAAAATPTPSLADYVDVPVNGRVVKLSRGDAEALLADALTRRDAGQPAGQPTPAAAGDGRVPATPQGHGAAPPSEARAKAVKAAYEKIVAGDDEEGAAALAEIVDMAVREATAKAAKPEDVQAAVHAARSQESDIAAQEEAMAAFTKDFPELGNENDRPFQTQFIDHAMLAAQAELRRAGVSEAEIRQYADTPEKARDSYLLLERRVRNREVVLPQGVTLKSGMDILKEAGEGARRALNRTPQAAAQVAAQRASVDQNRADRKRTGAVQIRTAATPRPDMAGEQQNPSIADARRQGFRTAIGNRRTVGIAAG